MLMDFNQNPIPFLHISLFNTVRQPHYMALSKVVLSQINIRKSKLKIFIQVFVKR